MQFPSIHTYSSAASSSTLNAKVTIRQEYLGGSSWKVLAVDAIYLYTISDSHNAVRQVNVETMASEAEMVSGQYY